MNKNILLLFLILFGFHCNAQDKFSISRAYTFSTSLRMKNGEFADWTKDEKCKMIFIFNISKSILTLQNGENKKNYDIIKFNDVEKNEAGNDVYTMICIDDEGEKCSFMEVFIEKNGIKSIMYHSYKNFMVAYTIPFEN